LQCTAILQHKSTLIHSFLKNLKDITKLYFDYDEILKILSDKYSRKIINFIRDSPKSTIQISVDAKIELSLVYRRLQKLQKCGLVDTSIKITLDGKKSCLYQGRIRGMNVRYLDDLIEVDMIANPAL